MIEFCVLILILSIATYKDLREYRIPDKLIVSSVVILLFLRIWTAPEGILSYVLGALVGGIIPLLAAVIVSSRGSGFLGGGDIKLLFVIGGFVGIERMLLVFVLFTLLHGLLLAIFFFVNRQYIQKEIPLAPLMLAAVVLNYAGEVIF